MVNNQIERSGEKKHIQIKFDRLTVRRHLWNDDHNDYSYHYRT